MVCISIRNSYSKIEPGFAKATCSKSRLRNAQHIKLGIQLEKKGGGQEIDEAHCGC
jgi:hypothetical protein